jgi:hypothetical protein
MLVIRLPRWGFDAQRADYYGAKFAVHIGPMLIFIGKAKEPDWPDIPNTPEQRELIEKHNAEMKRKYPELVEIEAVEKEDLTDG